MREWAREQSIAVIAMGGFNDDFDFAKDQGTVAFDELNRDNVLGWVRPETLIESSWTDTNSDLRNDYPNTLLDGFLVAGTAKTWQPKSRVIVREGDVPDTDRTSDHRPSELVIVLVP